MTRDPKLGADPAVHPATDPAMHPATAGAHRDDAVVWRLTPRPRPALVSVVVPIFNEADCLAPLAERVEAAMREAGVDHELVLVNDGSTDAGVHVMHEIATHSPVVSVVNLARNFGKEIATTAGLAHATGDAVMILDADLQDPPELVGAFVDAYCEGYDVVYGRRVARQGESWAKRTTARLFYRAMRDVGPVRLPENVGDFRLMSRRAVDALLRLPEAHRFMKGLFAWIGYPAKAVDYVREPRISGRTKWNYWKLLDFSIEGLTSFTTFPLRLTTILGFVIAAGAFAYGAVYFVYALVFGDPVAGFPTLILTILMLGGVQLLALGVIGEYLGRVFNETKRRPLYLVESVHWSGPATERREEPAESAETA